MSTASLSTLREVDSRSGEWLEIRLAWNPADDSLAVIQDATVPRATHPTAGGTPTPSGSTSASHPHTTPFQEAVR